MEEFKFFKERAKRFFISARENYKKGFYDLAIFDLEQCAQLLLKSKLLEKVGEFPKTHSLSLLLEEIGKLGNKKAANQFFAENSILITKLEDSYIAARYFPRKFFREEVKELFSFVKKLKKFLKEL